MIMFVPRYRYVLRYLSTCRYLSNVLDIISWHGYHKLINILGHRKRACIQRSYISISKYRCTSTSDTSSYIITFHNSVFDSRVRFSRLGTIWDISNIVQIIPKSALSRRLQNCHTVQRLPMQAKAKFMISSERAN